MQRVKLRVLNWGLSWIIQDLLRLLFRKRQVGERQTDWKTLHCWLQRRLGLRAKGCRASGYCEGTVAGSSWAVPVGLNCSQGMPMLNL